MRLLACSLLLAACTDAPVETRACNDTTFDFDTLAYAGFESTGPLAQGACTEYREELGAAYGYTYARITIGADEFVMQPIDFVGAKVLEGGRWSYVMVIDYANHTAGNYAVKD